MATLKALAPRLKTLSTAIARVPDGSDAERGSSTKRGYDRDWQKLRAAFLLEHPLCMCEECQEGKLRVTPATVVDHKIAVAERPDLRLVWSNLRSMSKEHHDAHTARTRGFGRAGTS